jgi:nucleoside-diphosphate-sugar epimerase
VILVTGADGFLGRHVVRRFLETSEPLRILVRDAARYPRGGVEVVEGDLRDPAALPAAMRGADAVVHLASKNVDRDGSGYDAVNVEGTRAVCRAAVDAGVRRVIYVSSVGVYGHGVHRDATETAPVRPDTPFSRSKAAAEAIVLGHHRRRDFTGVILRHRFVYGEGDESLIPRLVRAAKQFPVWVGGGRARTSVVLADDFAEIVRRVVAVPAETLGADDPVFHVTDGHALPWRELIAESCRMVGVRPPRFSVPFLPLYGVVRAVELLRRADPEAASVSSLRLRMLGRDGYFSNARLKALLPDARFAPLQEGLVRSAAYYARSR